jgi:EpsI family protein
LAGFLALFIGLYWNDVAEVVELWTQPRGWFSHGFVVLGMVVYLLALQRNSLSTKNHAPSSLMLVLLAGSTLAWFAAWAASIQNAEILFTLAILVFGLSAVLGKGAFRRVVFPLGLLTLALPIWGFLSPVLQWTATHVVTAMLSALDIAVFMEDNTITIPNGTFEIAQSCSGIGLFLVSLTLIGFLILSEKPGYARAIIIGVGGAFLGIASNWVRILLIVLIGHTSGLDHPIVREHVWFGWLVFLVLFFPYLWWAYRLCYRQDGVGVGAALVTSSDVIQPKIPLRAVLAICACTAVTPVASQLISHIDDGAMVAEIRFPERVGPFHRNYETGAQTWQPEFVNSDRQVRARYLNAKGASIGVFAATYFKQVQGAEVVYQYNDITGGAGRVVASAYQTLEPDAGQPERVKELLVESKTGERMRVWYWYQIGTAVTSSELAAKLWQVGQKMQGRSDASVVALASRCELASCANADKRLRVFLLEFVSAEAP